MLFDRHSRPRVNPDRIPRARQQGRVLRRVETGVPNAAFAFAPQKAPLVLKVLLPGFNRLQLATKFLFEPALMEIERPSLGSSWEGEGTIKLQGKARPLVSGPFEEPHEENRTRDSKPTG